MLKINEEKIFDTLQVRDHYPKSDLRYNETKNKLSSRIDVHDQLSEKYIDPWVLNLVKIKKGEKILDVGCGNGKQVISFSKVLKNKGYIFATDKSQELLDDAKNRAKSYNIQNVSFINHNMDDPFPFEDNSFDLISSCFSIYYAKESKKLIDEFFRLLKNGGRLTVVGPTPKNTDEFWKLHGKVSGKSIQEKALLRRARIEKEIIPLIKKYFINVVIKKFENPIHFKTTKQLIDYYSSSLLFEESCNTEKEKICILSKMKKEINKLIEEQGEYIIKKDVYGVVGCKK